MGEAAGPFTRQQAREAAERVISQGKVGAILVAGGQGTRLGFPHPKGMYPIGPVSHRSLFQMHVEQLLAVAARYRTRIPLFLMTSPATHDETVAYFREHDRFGLAAEDLHVFCQGMMPAVDDRGRLLLESKHQIFLSPDGHGGMLAALDRSGGLSTGPGQGIGAVVLFSGRQSTGVDLRPRTAGLPVFWPHADMSTLVISKQEATDKVGNVVSVDGRLRVIEYSDLPLEVAERRDARGELLLWAGSIAVHVFRVDFLERAAKSRESLPYHCARKKVPFVDASGLVVTPPEANATKFEKFIFDLMPSARNAIVVEGDEQEIFGPLKNASGEAKDTPETTRAGAGRQICTLAAVGRRRSRCDGTLSRSVRDWPWMSTNCVTNLNPAR